MSRTLKAGSAYFLLVFAAGFALGVVRELWLAPWLGAIAAELLEMPIMLAVVVVSAGWTVRRFALPKTLTARLGTGALAVAWLLFAEIVLVIGLRGMTLVEYLAGRVPLTSGLYAASLALMLVMPWLLGRVGR